MKRIANYLLLAVLSFPPQLLLAQAVPPTTDAEALIPFRKKRKWGFSDPAGTLVIKPSHDTVGFYQADLAVAGKPGKLGLIDPTGEWVVDRQYDRIVFDPRYQRYWLRDRKTYGWFIYFADGRLLPPQELGLDANALQAWTDRTGLPPSGQAHRGYTLSRTGTKYAIQQPDGSSLALQGDYDTVLIARPYRLYFRQGAQWGVMSYREEQLFPAQFTELEPPTIQPGPRNEQDIYAVRRGEQWGLISWETGEILPYAYTTVTRLPHRERALFRLEVAGKFGFFDLTTSLLVAPKYQAIGPFDQRGLAPVLTAKGRRGYLNWNGTEYFVD